MNQQNASPQIMLLSDSDSAANLDRRLLREAGFPNSRKFSSGLEAARLLADSHTPGQANEESFKADLIICAGKPNDMDAEQFCSLVRLHPFLKTLPIILVLPNGSEVEQLKTLGCEADLLMDRPYAVSALRDAIEKLLKKRPSGKCDPEAVKEELAAFESSLATCGILLRQDRSPEDYFRVGMRCLKESRWNFAISAFNKAADSEELKPDIELGLAAAHHGKGDRGQFLKLLNQAIETLIERGEWRRAQIHCKRLLKMDTRARNPFFAEARKLIRKHDYEEAANLLAYGLSLTPREEWGERLAKICFACDNPQELKDALLNVLRSVPESSGLFEEIDRRIAKHKEDRKEQERAQAAERKWLLSRAMEPRKQGGMKGYVHPELADENIAPAAQILEDLDVEDLPFDGSAEDGLDEETGSETGAGVTEQLTRLEATTELFDKKPRFNEFLSVVKLTWKLARRSSRKRK